MSDQERQTWPAVVLVILCMLGSAGVAYVVKDRDEAKQEASLAQTQAKVAGMCERLGETYPADVLEEVQKLKAVQETLKLAIYDGMDDRYRRSDHDAFVEAFLDANPELKPPAE